LAKGVTKPLEHLRKGAEIIGKGKLDYQIKLKTGDEIEELAESFNRMASDLKRSREELEEYSKILEIRVKARTRELEELTESLDVQVKERMKELQEKMTELERFNRLAVGRELKMIELKEELEKIKKSQKNTRPIAK
jgi:nitrate/nitrite-specific signal transduction histidine kinase